MTNYIADFLQDNKQNVTEEKINQLYEKLIKDGYNITREVLGFVVLQRQQVTSDTLYNLKLDAQLVKALEVAIDKRIVTNYQYFHTAKTFEELKVLEDKALEELKEQAKTNK